MQPHSTFYFSRCRHSTLSCGHVLAAQLDNQEQRWIASTLVSDGQVYYRVVRRRRRQEERPHGSDDDSIERRCWDGCWDQHNCFSGNPFILFCPFEPLHVALYFSSPEKETAATNHEGRSPLSGPPVRCLQGGSSANTAAENTLCCTCPLCSRHSDTTTASPPEQSS